MSIHARNDFDAEAIPCPGCEYDLRGQIEPRCPECGQRFESLAEMQSAIERAMAVLEQAREWRAFGLAIILAAAVFGIGLSGFAIGLDLPNASVACCLAPLFFACGFAFVLFAKLLRWRLGRKIPKSLRQRLTGPLIVFGMQSFPFVAIILKGVGWVAGQVIAQYR